MQMPGWKGHFDLSKTKQEFWKLDEHSGVSELFLYVAVMAFLGALLLSNKEENPPHLFYCLWKILLQKSTFKFSKTR